MLFAVEKKIYVIVRTINVAELKFRPPVLFSLLPIETRHSYNLHFLSYYTCSHFRKVQFLWETCDNKHQMPRITEFISFFRPNVTNIKIITLLLLENIMYIYS